MSRGSWCSSQPVGASYQPSQSRSIAAAVDARVAEAVDELDRERRLAGAVDAGQQHRRSAVDGRWFNRNRLDGVRDRERRRTGRLEPAEDVRGLVDRRALVVRLEVAAVVRRGMGKRGQPVTERLEPRDLARLDRRPRRRRRADVHEREDVREAERRDGRCLGPVVVLGQPDDGLHRALVGRRSPARRPDRPAGDAHRRRAATGPSHAPSSPPPRRAAARRASPAAGSTRRGSPPGPDPRPAPPAHGGRRTRAPRRTPGGTGCR